MEFLGALRNIKGRRYIAKMECGSRILDAKLEHP